MLKLIKPIESSIHGSFWSKWVT